eukprot:Hpha_TRINITY_DN22401_c0_g1::TRINITY_DN22401_c0_g1_i1::g.95085::m.95085
MELRPWKREITLQRVGITVFAVVLICVCAVRILQQRRKKSFDDMFDEEELLRRMDEEDEREAAALKETGASQEPAVVDVVRGAKLKHIPLHSTVLHQQKKGGLNLWAMYMKFKEPLEWNPKDWMKPGELGTFPGPDSGIAGVPPPRELGELPAASSGPISWRACDFHAGLNNHRYMLMNTVVLATALRRPLVLPPETANLHSEGTKWTFREMFDVERLRKALHPLEILEMSAAEYQKAFANPVDLNMESLHAGQSLAATIRKVPPGTQPVRVGMHCFGSPQYIFRPDPPAVRVWAELVVGRAIRFHPRLYEIAHEVVRKAKAAMGNQGRLHMIHQRVRLGLDMIHYTPTLNCSKYGLDSVGCYLSGACTTGPHAIGDFDYAVGQMMNEGLIREGDAVFLGTNRPESEGVNNTLKVLRQAGVKFWVGIDAVLGEERFAELRKETLRSGVQIGAAELLVLSLGDGEFLGAHISSFTEHILELRNWDQWHSEPRFVDRAVYLDVWSRSFKCNEVKRNVRTVRARRRR